MPKVSVVIPTFNRRQMVREAVASVLAQTLADVEVIVVDDGSTDGTADALRAEFGGRICVVEQANQGESVARNRGIELATTEYVAFLDSDDLWEPEKLARQVEVLDARPEVVLVTSGFRFVDERGDVLVNADALSRSDDSVDAFALARIGVANPIAAGPSTVMVRSVALDAAGGYDPAIRYGEDYDLWLRVRLVGEFAAVPDVLAAVRRHEASQYNRLTPEMIDERLQSELDMTERFFAGWPIEPPLGLREQCLARRYVSIACMDYIIGRYDVGRERMERAIALDGTLARAGNAHIAREFGWAVRRHVEVTRGRVSDVAATFDCAMANWPPALRPMPRCLQRWLVEEIFGSLGWSLARHGAWRDARQSLMRVVRVDPSLACNRGFWSICFRAAVAR